MKRNGEGMVHRLLRLYRRISGRGWSREDLFEALGIAQHQGLIEQDTRDTIERVVQVSELRVRDIMIPAARMVVLQKSQTPEDIVPVVIASAHSRFPVIDVDRDKVVGILLAKDLLQYCGDNAPRFKMRDIVRSAVFVPESKRLNVLLREFRASRNHMAIVVDEYGSAAGLVTIEDVLEQIVGEIEDEYDFDEGAFIFKRGPNNYTVKAHTTIEEFNEYFDSAFDDSDFDTIGGLTVNAFGHLPNRGEEVLVDGFRFKVVRADSRRVRLLHVERVPEATPSAVTDAAIPSDS
jgi:magnesium and cobalt transporter